MWSSRLFWKIFSVYTGLTVTIAAAFLFVVSVWQTNLVREQLHRQLYDLAVLLRSQTAVPLQTDSVEPMQVLVAQLAELTETRMTLINVHGTVMADSDKNPSQMQNHKNRPELLQAAETGIGQSERRSPTLGIHMFYLALPVESNGKIVGFVRVAMDVRSIHQQVWAIRRLLWLMALVAGLATLGLTSTIVGRIIRPLTDLTRGARAIASDDYDERVKIHSRDELGVLADAFNHMQDELAHRQQKSREFNHRLTAVLSGMAEGVLAVDAENRILFANDASKTLLDINIDDLVGRPLWEVTRNRDLHDVVVRAANGNEPVEYDLEVPGPVRRFLLLRITRLPAESDPGLVAVLSDVTEIRQLEILRREFVANVSHELKTPLASIKAYAETLRMGALDDPQHNLDFVRRIEEHADQLHRLILELLQLARVETGQSFDFTKISVSDAVSMGISRHLEAAQAKQIQLTAELTDDPLNVHADAEGFRTIIDNLIGNAIKYTEQGGKVVVRCVQERDSVLIEVIDDGIGIAPQHQNRIFERFFRVDKARSQQVGGTGLGLSIVKHLVQAFGGKVDVTSQLEKGTTFCVRLPLATGNE